MRIETKGSQLVILLEGMERLWALKASICLKAEDVTSITWHEEKPAPPFALRAPGTGLPGVLCAGSFWRRSGWEFWYLRMRMPGFLVITTKGRRYKVLRLTTDEATGFLVRDWYSKHQRMRNIA